VLTRCFLGCRGCQFDKITNHLCAMHARTHDFRKRCREWTAAPLLFFLRGRSLRKGKDYARECKTKGEARGGFMLASGLPFCSLKSGGCSAERIMCYLARDHVDQGVAVMIRVIERHRPFQFVRVARLKRIGLHAYTSQCVCSPF
jgi:hypothetical protein